jgi:hypothetical protein
MKLFFVGFFFGNLLMFYVSSYFYRKFRKKRLLIRMMTSEVYHQKYMNYICRMEGLLNILLLERKDRYAELIRSELLKMKKEILETVKKYEIY